MKINRNQDFSRFGEGVDMFDGYQAFPLLERGMADTSYELIGAGGDQLVFSSPGSNQVLKVSHRLLSSPEYNSTVMERFWPNPHEAELLEQAEQEILLYRLRHTELEKAFPGHLIPEVVEAKYIPLNGRTCRQIWPDAPLAEQDVRMFLTLGRWQKKVPQLLEPDVWKTQTLGVGYVEKDPGLDSEVYIHASQRLLTPYHTGDAAAEINEDWHSFLELHGTVSIVSIAQLLHDPTFWPVAGDFFARAAHYTEETGENLDLQPNNIIFYQDKANSWQYKLVDALCPPPRAMIDETRAILRSVLYGRGTYPALSRKGKIAMMNAFNYTRTINAFNRRLGTGARVDLVDEQYYSGYQLREPNWKWALEQIQSIGSGSVCFPNNS